MEARIWAWRAEQRFGAVASEAGLVHCRIATASGQHVADELSDEEPLALLRLGRNSEDCCSACVAHAQCGHWEHSPELHTCQLYAGVELRQPADESGDAAPADLVGAASVRGMVVLGKLAGPLMRVATQ